MTAVTRVGLVVAFALSGLPAGGCAHQAEAPSATLAAFGAALERGDYRAAYALTSAAYRSRSTYDAFAAGMAADVAGTKAFGQRAVAAAPSDWHMFQPAWEG